MDKPSPDAEKPAVKKAETTSAPQSGVSPLGAVFLSLLTTLAVFSGLFAFHDKITPYLHHYLQLEAPASNDITSPLPGFVPVPMMNESLSVNHANDTAYDDLAARQQQLEATIAALQDKVQSAPPPTADTRDEAYSAEIADALASAQRQLAKAAARITTLETEINETRQLAQTLVNKPSTNNDVRGLVAFQTLQSQALGGQPFQEALQRVIALLKDTQSIEAALSKLEQLAPTGRKSLLQLQESFGQSVSQFMQTQEQAKPGFLGKVKNNLKSFIRIRRTDGTGSNDEIILAQAEELLTKGNVKLAYSEVLKLDEAHKAAFAPWLAEARNYFEIPEALTAVQLELTRSIVPNE